jgi:hypothetical protein
MALNFDIAIVLSDLNIGQRRAVVAVLASHLTEAKGLTVERGRGAMNVESLRRESRSAVIYVRHSAISAA